MKDICEIKDCTNVIGPGASKIGYRGEDDRIREVKVCAEQTWIIMMAPRGTFNIKPDRSLERIGPSKHFF